MDLAKLNAEVNGSLRFDKERNGWSAPEGVGNCQAFAATKYAALRKAGIPARMVFAQTAEGPHVVVETATGVLDNQTPEIKPLAERKDLTPAYYFDDHSMYDMDDKRIGFVEFIPGWKQFLKGQDE